MIEGIFYVMVESEDIRYMQRAISLSLQGSGAVNPNPLVGAVIVKNGRVIGEGYHQQFGGPHAEINAINQATEDLKGATIYVTLEPCAHHGKTPPCAEAIIARGFSRVVIGMGDPNPLVNGKGVQLLKQAGIAVDSGILEDEISTLNEVFIKYICSGKAFVALKTAMTLDGKIATQVGDSKWITGEKSREFVHQLRHKYAAIMVGVNTVIADNPSLTDRSSLGLKSHPLRIVVDSTARTPLDAEVLNTKTAPTIVAVTKAATSSAVEAIKQKGARVLVCKTHGNGVCLTDLVHQLSLQGIDSILLEGGSRLNFSAIDEGIVDKIYAFISPKLIGGEHAFTPLGGRGYDRMDQAITLDIQDITRFDEDILVVAKLKKNETCLQE